MLKLLKLYIFVNCILIQCVIPGTIAELIVRRVDQNLIESKRQDTRDMCRIFTEETEQLDKLNQINKLNKISSKTKTKYKVKRSVQEINPALNSQDTQRVERIVDKLYDDLPDSAEKMDYKRDGELSTNKTTSKRSGRKYFFAPKELEFSKRVTETYEQRSNKSSLETKLVQTQRFKHGIIPYYIDSKTYDVQLVEAIMTAFDYMEKATCLRLQRLREKPTDTASLKEVEWLYITNPTGIRQCVHSNEQSIVKGVQMIIFGYDCMSLGDIVHELMHVLGFPHEHNRPDRDQHITILWDNIKPGYKRYFEIRNSPMFGTLPYDYSSVLHYPSRAFSRNGQATIMTQSDIKIGQREGLSDRDIEKIGLLYTGECVQRNKEYLLTTCPSVIRSDVAKHVNTSMKDIEKYYEKKIWPFGIVNYRLSDKQFSEEERDNIAAVITHIEKETCIEFRNIDDDPNDSNSNEEQLDRENTRTADEVKLEAHTENNNQTKKIYDIRIASKVENATTNNEAEQGTEIDQIPFGNNSENEIITDEASKTNENDVYSDEEYSITTASNELSPKGTKRFLRVTSSLRTKDLTAKKRISTSQSTNKTKVYVEATKKYTNRNTTAPLSPSRRHATNVLTFIRSPKPGCACPKSPGAPGSTSVTIEINTDCFNSANDLLHLVVHILGLGHQHNSHDRDSYLHIVWNQLTEDIKEDLKQKLPLVASVGFPYDYQSVKHFPWLQIKNGRTNIMYPIWNDGWTMGHWQGLSYTDVQKLNILYAKQCDIRRKVAEESG